MAAFTIVEVEPILLERVGAVVFRAVVAFDDGVCSIDKVKIFGCAGVQVHLHAGECRELFVGRGRIFVGSSAASAPAAGAEEEADYRKNRDQGFF